MNTYEVYIRLSTSIAYNGECVGTTKIFCIWELVIKIMLCLHGEIVCCQNKKQTQNSLWNNHMVYETLEIILL